MPPAAAHQDAEQVLLPMAGADGQAESRKQQKLSPDRTSTHPTTAARGVDSKHTSQVAPRARAPTRRKQRQGRRFQTEFSGCSTHQHSHPPNTARGSLIPKRIPRASAATRRIQRQGCRFQRNFSGRSTCPKLREGRRFQAEFAGQSTRQRCHASQAKFAGRSTRPQQREGRQLQTDFLDFLRTLQALALPHADDSDAGELENSHDASARAFRHARSPEGCIPPTTARPCQAHPRQIRNKIEYNRGGVGSLVYVSYGGGVGAVLYVLRCRC